jgi:cellulose synthase/poly-beta-1,6-N-acetylglucosamine synthase-like glycosyltransferase
MKTLFIFWIIIQLMVGINLFLPFVLYICKLLRGSNIKKIQDEKEELDYAIIVTAYEQITLLPSVVDSILRSNYSNYLIYIVADKCDISTLNFSDDRVVLLKPEQTLANNTKSHFYAINRFERAHTHLTIIDSDNLLEPNYLNELNSFFNRGFIAIQGLRAAKNLNTNYACLDEAGDMYYRFVDRKLLFEVGSSASLAGSGMAFTTAFYRECLELLSIEGAGFDKVLQMEILNRGKRIAFAENAIVFDEKTSKSTQLVKQRARWINTWFKYAGKGLRLTWKGLLRRNLNQFLCGMVFSRPPLFIVFGLTMICILINLFLTPQLIFFWGVVISSFFFIFFTALRHFRAPKLIYKALGSIPIFMFLQVLSLFKVRQANSLSTATVHYHESKIEEISKSPLK